MTVRFGRRTALNGVSVEFAPGEATVIAGSNGAGKSTLLRCLAGAIVPDRGRCRLRYRYGPKQKSGSYPINSACMRTGPRGRLGAFTGKSSTLRLEDGRGPKALNWLLAARSGIFRSENGPCTLPRPATSSIH
jgi:energy-coupling factor transporter ATP-binding protein EcfA2